MLISLALLASVSPFSVELLASELPSFLSELIPSIEFSTAFSVFPWSFLPELFRWYSQPFSSAFLKFELQNYILKGTKAPE